MKFLQILGYATLALAVPSPLALDDSVLAAEFAKRDDSIIFEGLQKRATVTSTLTNSVGTLQSVTASNIKAISTYRYIIH